MPARRRSRLQALNATFATISNRMRLNFFANASLPEPTPNAMSQPPAVQVPQAPQPRSGRTFPADEVVWGIVIRNGFDEIDDPWYHRGTTQHAYLEGNDNVAICGFRPPQSGPRTRRRSRLGLPTTGEHPMCGMCARMVVAPRPRVPVPVQPPRPAVAVPVAGTGRQPMPVAPRVDPAGYAGPPPPVSAPGAATSPWVRRAAGVPPEEVAAPGAGSHDSGLMARGVHTEAEG
jgi:hypothetical protein